MKIAMLTALLAFLVLAPGACTYTPTGLHPISGTNEELEMFKDDSPD